jgi:hypothetical protein
MLRFLEVGYACGGALALRLILLARNRVISGVILLRITAGVKLKVMQLFI